MAQAVACVEFASSPPVHQTEDMKTAPTTLIAHRGDRSGGVENTLPAFVAAAEAGALFLECDVQLSADGVPVIMHDDRLERLCRGLKQRVSSTPLADLRRLTAPFFRLATLAELLAWLAETPRVTLFVEIKPPLRRRLDDRRIVRLFSDMIAPELRPRIVFIGQSARLLEAFAACGLFRIGWVASRRSAPRCPLDFAFLPRRMADGMRSWHKQGARVALYTVNDAGLAEKLLAQGADFIETNHFADMAEVWHG